MQPLSLLLRRHRRHKRLFLLIVALSITALTWLKLWDSIITWLLGNSSDSCPPNSNQIPYPAVQDEPPERRLRPPIYQKYRHYEDLLSRSYLQNKTGAERYISFENHAWGSGWGNVLQEMIFNSLLAWEARRSFVWDDYTWNRNGSDYGEFNGKVIPARIPLSTMVAGHFLGFNSSDAASYKNPHPISISRRVYDSVCPPRKRTNIHRRHVQKHFQRQNPERNVTVDQLTGKETLRAWASFLDSPSIRNRKCLQVQKDTPQIFDIWLLGTTRMQNLWGPLIRSPVLSNWKWSPLISRAFLKNLHLFMDSDGPDSHSPSSFLSVMKGMLPRSISLTTATLSSASGKEEGNLPSTFIGVESSTLLAEELRHPNTTDLSDVPKELLDSSVRLPILALHIRRGDFKDHCAHLANYSSTYSGFNSFPDVAELDAFYVPYVVNSTHQTNASSTIPPNAVIVDSEQEKYEIYYRHCLPDIQQIVQRVRDVVHDFEMDLRRRAEKEAADQPWWAWGSRRQGSQHSVRMRSSSTSGDSTQATEQAQIGSVKAKRRKPGTHNYAKLAKRSSIPRSPSQAQALKRAPSSTHFSLANQIIRKVYIMSNGEQAWLDEVVKALRADAAKSMVTLGKRQEGDWEFQFEWDSVGTSRDLHLGWEEKPVSQALDMYIGQRAEIFIGNGFSSMTSNIVMLRLKAGLDSVRTRFW
ncbi:hypothetical protein CVT24_010791 [Panaeolus cyanescens]|uniref:Uncharacterized protein n=1 Tax=Panaeolus cyanescens TaxID=181874 RepID=A0A409VGU3_9AGAR|nr:hypothetical protein CVT24_010791 [Panaeolus cyanescens]